MQLNDAIPERRNLIVFCLTTVIFIVGGGDIESDLKLPLFGIVLDNPENLIAIYWFVFIYLIIRYLLVFRGVSYSDESRYIYNKKSWSSALKSLYMKCMPKQAIFYFVKWGVNGNTKYGKFKIKLKEAGAENYTKANLHFSVDSVRESEESKLYLILNLPESTGKSLKSEEIKPTSTSFILQSFFLVLICSFFNKYASDWYGPLIFTVLTLGFICTI
ncbi:hypothetical protein [Alteromonas lipolytica]|uniref:Uncharacterized protein n=1 Tax=Alteromonas lipolytica TaxID=1856405 RepID=A0A1E8FJE7_9ALTE|nr:hypothetical protein [Alteromonas lipolytica]OFI36061.1 hypothetical protein BFC17_10360 [Alteromonas lipolytica]GGF71288.1 hypothetical protein GCM10011338_24340 [Alteromonas lipolytica]